MGHGAAAAQTCLSFARPAAGDILGSDICTVSVEACPEVQSVVFRAKYLATDDLTWNIATLGTLTRKPYTLIWNIAELQNQLYTGMTFMAEAKLKGGKTRKISQEGVFLIHNPITRPHLVIPHALRDNVHAVKPLKLMSAVTSSEGFARAGWNSDGLLFRIEVRDRAFYADLPKEKYARLGVEILLDPGQRQLPYPSEQTLSYVAPLMGKPYQVVTKPHIDSSGSFSLVRSTVEVDYPVSIRQEDFRGYIIDFAIPWSALGAQRPQKLGINMTAKALDDKGAVRTLSWIQKSANEQYCPAVWGEARLGRKPLFTNGFVLWLVSFAAGIAIGALGMGLFRLHRHSADTIRKFEASEEEQEMCERIGQTIESNITSREFSLDVLSSQVSIAPAKADKLIRRCWGRSFVNHLMHARVEIAKERLRSSHSSETAVASLCGFASVDEMEKYFRKFAATTPYKYREEYQVT
jgi:AraC-like DNA-binding protein